MLFMDVHENRRLRRFMNSARIHCMVTQRSSCSMKKCCAMTLSILCCSIIFLWLIGTKKVLPVLYPEQALWVENLCKIDIFTVENTREDGSTSSSQRDRILKHHPLLTSIIGPMESSVRYLKDSFASGPVEMDSDLIVLVGMHHKTGSVLARKVFASACLRVRQCGVFLVTSASQTDMDRTLTDSSVRLVSHPQWPWTPQQLVPAARPYLFVHFWRNPASKLSSGYLYHKTGVERWTSTFQFSATRICTSPRESLCDSLKVCRDCCVDVMRQAKTDQAVGFHASKALSFTCSQMKRRDGTLLEMLTELPLKEGIMVEAAVEFFESYRMAQIWNQTFSDPRTLNIELDAMMLDFSAAVDHIIGFLASRTHSPNKAESRFSKVVAQQKRQISQDALVFNMGSESTALASLYTSIYNSPAYKHGTGGEEKAVARAMVDSLLCNHSPLRTLFHPVFDLLGRSGPNCPQRRLSHRLHSKNTSRTINSTWARS